MSFAQPYPYHGGVPSQASRRGLAADERSAGQNVAFQERIISSVAGALLTAYGLSTDRRGALPLAGLGGALLYRGMTGHCHLYGALGMNTAKPHPATVIPAQHGNRVEKCVTILQSPQELYSFWREFENLPKVMKHLKSVESIDRVRSHWVAEGPMGKEIAWDAEVFNDIENEMIAWRSLPGGDVDTAGSVHFKPLEIGRGTQVTVNLKYDPPAGKVGAWVASLLGQDPARMIAEDLQRFKQLIEAGAASTMGQPAGNASPTKPGHIQM
jgi:uncharacterized membrane protein